MANEPTFNPNAYREFDEIDRRNRAVQDLYEPGSTFKVVTASAAIEEKVMPIDTMIDTSRGQIRDRQSRVVTTTPTTTACCRSPTSSSSRATSARSRSDSSVGTERLSRVRRALRLRPSGVARLSRREPRHRLEPGQVDRQRARVGVDGLPGRRDAAADGGGGQLGRQRRRVRRAARRPRGLSRRPPLRGAAEDRAAHDQRRHRRDADRRSWKASSSAAPRSAAQIPGYTIAGKTGTAAKLVNGHYSTSDYNASFVGFLPSRDPALAIIVVIDSPHGARATPAASVSAPIFKRIAEATLRYLGIAADDQPAAAGAGRARDDPADADARPAAPTRDRSSAWSPTARRARFPTFAA